MSTVRVERGRPERGRSKNCRSGSGRSGDGRSGGGPGDATQARLGPGGGKCRGHRLCCRKQLEMHNHNDDPQSHLNTDAQQGVPDTAEAAFAREDDCFDANGVNPAFTLPAYALSREDHRQAPAPILHRFPALTGVFLPVHNPCATAAWASRFKLLDNRFRIDRPGQIFEPIPRS